MPSTNDAVSVCFVCLGNICRSPTAEGLMLHLVAEAGLQDHIYIDSAGTSAYHIGEPADPRSQATASARGVALPSVARQFEPDDLARFHYVIAMDRSNLRDLQRLRAPAGTSAIAELRLLREFDPAAGGDFDVPDPYLGGKRGFDQVFEICQRSCRKLLDHLIEAHR